MRSWSCVHVEQKHGKLDIELKGILDQTVAETIL